MTCTKKSANFGGKWSSPPPPPPPPRYSEKLSSVGSSLKDDTYLTENDAKFAGDMTTWFNVDYGIFLCTSLKALEYRYKNSCYHGTT